MKLSQIQQSKSVRPEEDQNGGGSWGVFISPERPGYVIKLFYDERQFDDEKEGYDRVLGECCLKQFACKYSVVSIQLDTSNYPKNRKDPPFYNALLIPYLSNPLWKIAGKLGSPETDEKLTNIGLDVNELKARFCKVGVASWEVTFFVHTISRNAKAIDFTFSQVLLDSNSDSEE